MQNEPGKVNQRSLDRRRTYHRAGRPDHPAPPALPANNLLATATGDGREGNQRQQRARAARQVFLVSMGGYDTHSAQEHRASEPVVATRVGDFVFRQRWINQMGIANDVTLFTASDFGRTLTRTATAAITAGARITSSSAVP